MGKKKRRNTTHTERKAVGKTGAQTPSFQCSLDYTNSLTNTFDYYTLKIDGNEKGLPMGTYRWEHEVQAEYIDQKNKALAIIRDWKNWDYSNEALKDVAYNQVIQSSPVTPLKADKVAAEHWAKQTKRRHPLGDLATGN